MYLMILENYLPLTDLKVIYGENQQTFLIKFLINVQVTIINSVYFFVDFTLK